MRGSRPTLRDVAERSGYALRTVKKVMSGEENVREKTRMDVLRAAEELQYTCNHLARALAKYKESKVAIVYTPITKTYFPEIERGFLACAADRKDFGLSVEFHLPGQQGWRAQNEVLEALLEQEDIDGVVMQPASAYLLDAQIGALVETGKKVITFGADAPHSRRMSYVGPDAHKAGRIGGQILANYIGRRGRVFIISQANEHMQTIERKRGFQEKIREHYPEIESYELCIPENSNLYYDMVRSIVANEDVSGLFCTDADTYIAGEVLRDIGRRGIAVVGFDLSAESREMMRQDYVQVILEQQPADIAYRALNSMFEMLYLNRIPEPLQYTNLSILTSECLSD